MEILNQNTKYVNGPINVVRMQGKVNDIDKVIYLFMDFHSGIQIQTECDNIYSRDVQLYLAENFADLTDSGKMYDFFLETHPSWIADAKSEKNHQEFPNYKDIYIGEVVKLFNKIFNYDPDKNLVRVSDYLKNIRLHYMDVRDYFHLTSEYEMDYANNLIQQLWRNTFINKFQVSEILKIITNLNNYLNLLTDILITSKTSNNSKKIIKQINVFNPENDEIIKDLVYLIDKIFNKYNNDNVKKIMNKQKNIIIDYLKELITLCEQINDNFSKILIEANNETELTLNKFIGFYYYGLPTEKTRIFLTEMSNSLSILNIKFIYFFTRFMDLFFLRRFLDKDYITNAITYTGIYHSMVYIEILNRDFGFEITHASQPKDVNIEQLNEEIKGKNSVELSSILYPKTLLQCSDMTHFPSKFL
ncbi:hypothetical protein QLL95_gp0140 [Cotonvirus japonicus]|uniref:Uncharacterized protein n=1 Tax=Cotonvirus japonicus TaxID=2811091 RepID=A0ABM7NR43_9VIRU|nr:hypothetical protein QLL95_gp0140 [Cotonvirus japonicus]BCS82629.1 hypothetical protein [Cotonvirus japonicus]